MKNSMNWANSQAIWGYSTYAPDKQVEEAIKEYQEGKEVE